MYSVHLYVQHFEAAGAPVLAQNAHHRRSPDALAHFPTRKPCQNKRKLECHESNCYNYATLCQRMCPRCSVFVQSRVSIERKWTTGTSAILQYDIFQSMLNYPQTIQTKQLLTQKSKQLSTAMVGQLPLVGSPLIVPSIANRIKLAVRPLEPRIASVIEGLLSTLSRVK